MLTVFMPAHHPVQQPSPYRICQAIGIQPISESLQNEREEEVQNKVTGEAVVIDNGGSGLFHAEKDDLSLDCWDDRVEMLEEERETATSAEITTVLLPPMTKTLQNGRQVLQLDDESAMEAGRKSEVNAVKSSGRISSREETSGREYRTDGSLSREDLKQHFGKKLDDAAYSLGVSRSTMKRACRVNGLKKWPSPKRKKVKPLPSYLKHVNECVRYGAKQIPKFGNSDPSCSGPPPMHTTAVVTHTMPNVTPKQDEGSVTVKATYGDEMIRFRLTFSSRKVDLMEKVTLRWPLKGETFNIKYGDDDGDWLLIACDEDLEECIRISNGKSIIKMLVQLTRNDAP